MAESFQTPLVLLFLSDQSVLALTAGSQPGDKFPRYALDGVVRDGVRIERVLLQPLHAPDGSDFALMSPAVDVRIEACQRYLMERT